MTGKPPRVTMTTLEQADHRSKEIWNAQIQAHGRMTNMKKTLARSAMAFEALMFWYPLRDQVATFLGERATLLFAHAISTETDCLICSTFFRKVLIERGENPDQLTLDAKDETVIKLGRQIAKNPNRIDDALFDALRTFTSEDNIVDLIAFGAIMLATNIFNNALRIPLDEYLYAFKRR